METKNPQETPPAVSSAPPKAAPTPEEQKDINENKAIALLSYLGILCLIPLLLNKDSKFVKFHAKQGLVLLIGWFFVWLPFVNVIVWIAIVIFSVWGVINVLSGSYKELPVIGGVAKQFNI